MDLKILVDAAKKASKNTYSPYSKFPVGASLITKNNQIFIGCNVENASYGLTNCAERTCLFSAYANGVKKEDILALVIYSPASEFVYPCGACRQVMVELLDMDCKVYLVHGECEDLKETTVKELMPFSFSSEDLKNV